MRIVLIHNKVTKNHHKLLQIKLYFSSIELSKHASENKKRKTPSDHFSSHHITNSKCYHHWVFFSLPAPVINWITMILKRVIYVVVLIVITVNNYPRINNKLKLVELVVPTKTPWFINHILQLFQITFQSKKLQ